ncbi:MAG TPA: tail fiber domain-containing protein [Xanthobacteraceae bacterium]|jgi:hypothetical protein
MGGTTQEKNTISNTNQSTGGATSANTSGTQSGNTSSSQFQTQALTPWAGTADLLGSILGKLGGIPTGLTPTEDAALRSLSGLAAAGNPYAGAIGGAATELLGGGPDRTAMVDDAYAQYRAALQPFASGAYLDPSSNPALQPYLDTIRNDVATQVNGMFAGAGRDLSGLNQQTLARGIAQAEAPVLMDAYNRAMSDRVAAIDKLYGAGNTTGGLLSSLDRTRLANMQAGIGAADAALNAQMWGPTQMLAIEAQRRGIPLQALAAQYGMVLPAAQAFGTRTASGSSAGASTGQNATSSAGTSTSRSVGTDSSQTTQSTPFNPLSLLPYAFTALPGTSLAGMGASALGGGLFSSLSNGFLGGGDWLTGKK